MGEGVGSVSGDEDAGESTDKGSGLNTDTAADAGAGASTGAGTDILDAGEGVCVDASPVVN